MRPCVAPTASAQVAAGRHQPRVCRCTRSTASTPWPSRPSEQAAQRLAGAGRPHARYTGPLACRRSDLRRRLLVCCGSGGRGVRVGVGAGRTAAALGRDDDAAAEGVQAVVGRLAGQRGAQAHHRRLLRRRVLAQVHRFAHLEVGLACARARAGLRRPPASRPARVHGGAGPGARGRMARRGRHCIPASAGAPAPQPVAARLAGR